MNLQEAKSILNKLQFDLKRIAQNEAEFDHNYNNPEERFKHNLYRKIAEKSADIVSLVEYMDKPIVQEGLLEKREDGRYGIKGSNDYFTSGQPIEIWDKEYEVYVKTRLEYREDYYAYAFGPNVKLEGLKARIR